MDRRKEKKEKCSSGEGKAKKDGKKKKKAAGGEEGARKFVTIQRSACSVSSVCGVSYCLCLRVCRT